MQSLNNKYDVVVIGSGIGGLVCAGLLAKKGFKVLIVERNAEPGGRVCSFMQDGFTFDTFIHWVPSCGKGGVVYNTLDELGIIEEVEFLKSPFWYRAFYPEHILDVPADENGFVEIHIKAFPSESNNIRNLFKKIKRIYNQIVNTHPYQGVLKTILFSPDLIKYINKTFSQFLDDFLSDKKLKSVISACWTYNGLPPSRLSALVMISTIMQYTSEGCYCCKGGFSNVSRALVKGIEKFGGQVLLKKEIQEIIVEDNSVKAIKLENDSYIQARNIVSNADANYTFFHLIGANKLKNNFIVKLKNMVPSTSAFAIYLGVDVDMSRALPENFFNSSYSPIADYEDNQRLNYKRIVFSIPSLIDNSISPPSKHSMFIIAPSPYYVRKNWDEIKDDITKRLIKNVEKIIPFLSKHIVTKKIITPLDIEKYSSTTEGAMYGWENSIAHIGSRRLSPITPISGLYLVGSWTYPAGGFRPGVISGGFVSEMVSKNFR